jgi:hypothetical protein
MEMAMDRARVAEIGAKYEALAPVLDERQRRLWVAAEARSLGRGGHLLRSPRRRASGASGFAQAAQASGS